jgi:hypothetical protein
MEAMRRIKETSQWLLAIVLALYSARFYVSGARAAEWDFKIYYSAAVVDARGQNPYELSDLQQAVQPPPDHPFVYPPVTLNAFRPLTWLDYATARTLFLMLKLAALVALVLSWRKRLFGGETHCLYPCFCLLAFNTSAVRDLVAGNISVFEQCLLWSAFYLFIQQRSPVKFCLLVGVTALFKLFPIVFLALLVTSRQRGSIRCVLATAAAFLFAFVAPFLAQTERTGPFLANLLARSDEAGAINPTLLALLHQLAPEGPGTSSRIVSALIFVVLISVMLGITAWAWRQAADKLGDDRKRVQVFLWTIGYALILPRFKDYSFLLIVPASYYALARLTPKYGVAMVIAIELIGVQLCPMYREQHWLCAGYLRLVLCEYRALLLVVITWVLYVYWLLACVARRHTTALAPESA